MVPGRVLALALLLGVAAPASAEELTLSVAISMKDAIEELGRGFTQARPGVVLRHNLGASGELGKQIEAGAPVDLFISAAARQMDELETKGLLVPGSRRVFARNVLVAVKPADSRLDLARPSDLLDPRVKRIVIGNPKTVPVGQYTEESLRALGLWDGGRGRWALPRTVAQAPASARGGRWDGPLGTPTEAGLLRGG